MAELRYCAYGHLVADGSDRCRAGHAALDGATAACLWCDRSDGTHSPACERAERAERRLQEIAPLPDER